jgi:hypothetical protein
MVPSHVLIAGYLSSSEKVRANGIDVHFEAHDRLRR